MRSRKHDIEKYLRGELTPAEMHALESEALNDPFLAEALEGVEQTGADTFLYDLHRINRSVHDRSRKRARRNNDTIRMWGWTAGIAATVMLVAVSGFLVVTLLQDQRERELTILEEDLAMTEEDLALLNDRNTTDTLTVVAPPARPSLKPEKEPPTRATQPSSLSTTSGISAAKKESATDERKTELEVADAEEVVKGEEPIKNQADATEADDAKDQIALADADLAQSELKVKEEAATVKREADKSVSESRVSEDVVSKRRKDRVAAGQARSEAASPPAEGTSSDPRVVKGKVTSNFDGAGLPGVNVIVKGSAKGAVTDAEGNYQLTVPGDDTKLVFSFIGYQTLEMDAEGKRELNVQLDEDVTSLSEVVVTGYGSVGNNSEVSSGLFNYAEPNGGRTDFQNYLNNAVKYPEQALKNKIQGRVTVRFTVETDGALTHFEVVKGLGYGCEEELIRAIREGPMWKPSTQGDNAVSDKVRVRYRFELPK
jgi:TonB family protein